MCHVCSRLCDPRRDLSTAKVSITLPVVINLPTRTSLAAKTKDSSIPVVGTFNKRSVRKQISFPVAGEIALYPVKPISFFSFHVSALQSGV